jgi:hypothetical protein
MDSNTHSTRRATRPADGLAALAGAVNELAAQDLDGLADGVRARRVLELRATVDRLEGQWLKELATVDACGAAGADQGERAGSTAGWLGNRLRLGAGAATCSVRTARAVFGGSLAATADALTGGAISPAHGQRRADASPSWPAAAWKPVGSPGPVGSGRS